MRRDAIGVALDLPRTDRRRLSEASSHSCSARGARKDSDKTNPMRRSYNAATRTMFGMANGRAGVTELRLARRFISEDVSDNLAFEKLTYSGGQGSLAPIGSSPSRCILRESKCNRASVRYAPTEIRPDMRIHLVAESDLGCSIDGPAAVIAADVGGTFTMLKATRDYWPLLDKRATNRFEFVDVQTRLDVAPTTDLLYPGPLALSKLLWMVKWCPGRHRTDRLTR